MPVWAPWSCCAVCRRRRSRGARTDGPAGGQALAGVLKHRLVLLPQLVARHAGKVRLEVRAATPAPPAHTRRGHVMATMAWRAQRGAHGARGRGVWWGPGKSPPLHDPATPHMCLGSCSSWLCPHLHLARHVCTLKPLRRTSHQSPTSSGLLGIQGERERAQVWSLGAVHTGGQHNAGRRWWWPAHPPRGHEAEGGAGAVVAAREGRPAAQERVVLEQVAAEALGGRPDARAVLPRRHASVHAAGGERKGGGLVCGALRALRKEGAPLAHP